MIHIIWITSWKTCKSTLRIWIILKCTLAGFPTSRLQKPMIQCHENNSRPDYLAPVLAEVGRDQSHFAGGLLHLSLLAEVIHCRIALPRQPLRRLNALLRFQKKAFYQELVLLISKRHSFLSSEIACDQKKTCHAYKWSWVQFCRMLTKDVVPWHMNHIWGSNRSISLLNIVFERARYTLLTYLLYCNSPLQRLATQWGPIATP